MSMKLAIDINHVEKSKVKVTCVRILWWRRPTVGLVFRRDM